MEDLNTLDKVKRFIKWCKANKIKSFKHENIEFELSDFGFIDSDPINQSETAQEIKEEINLEETEQSKEEEELLFWSSNT